MAKRRGKKRHYAAKKRYHKKRKSGAKRKSGFFGRASVTSSYSLDTLPRILLSAAILRFGSGVVYWWFRKQFQTPGVDPKKTTDNFNKAKIIFPTLVAIASAKKWIPQLPGLTPMAIAMAFFSIVENFDSLRDLFDLKALDEGPKPASQTPAKPDKGFGAISARTWAETRQALQNMHPRSGMLLTNQSRRFNGISFQRAPRTFSGRDPRAMKARIS